MKKKLILGPILASIVQISGPNIFAVDFNLYL